MSRRPRYVRELGLQRDPFAPEETRRGFYTSGAREARLDDIVGPLLGEPGSERPLVAVTAEPEGGKSSLFRALLERAPGDARVVRIAGGVFLSARALLVDLARALDLSVGADATRETLHQRVLGRIRELLERHTPTLVLVDDAEQLEPEALDELAEIAELATQRRLVRVVLFATPAFPAVMEGTLGAARSDDLVHYVELEPFDFDELRGYVHFRLARAGLRGDPPLEDTDYQEIYRRSGGLPGRAHAVAADLLEERAETLRRRRAPRRVAAGATVGVLALVLVVLLWPGQDEERPGPVAADEDGRVADQERLSEERSAEDPGAPVAADSSPGADTKARTAAAADAEATAATTRDVASPAGAGTTRPPSPGTQQEESSPAARSAAEEGGRRTGARRDTPAAGVDGAASTAAADARAGTEPRDRVEAASAVAEAEAGTEPGDQVDAASAGAAVATSASPGVPRATAGDSARGPAPLARREPDRYLFQVHALASRQSAESWIDRQANAGDYGLYERDRTPRYVVLYGDYADLTAARRAAVAYRQQTGLEPWVRRVGPVRDELRRVR